jgi:hypothetical protein
MVEKLHHLKVILKQPVMFVKKWKLSLKTFLSFLT